MHHAPFAFVPALLGARHRLDAADFQRLHRCRVVPKLLAHPRPAPALAFPGHGPGNGQPRHYRHPQMRSPQRIRPVAAVLVWRARRRNPSGAIPALGTGRKPSEALWVAVLYAATDEFHQTFVPSREGCVRDVLIDSCGAVIVAYNPPSARRAVGDVMAITTPSSLVLVVVVVVIVVVGLNIGEGRREGYRGGTIPLLPVPPFCHRPAVPLPANIGDYHFLPVPNPSQTRP